MSNLRVPKWILYALLIAVVASWLPFALIAKARAVRGGDTRVHIFQDMGNQPRLNTQARAAIFADERAMRPEVPGTVARRELRDDDHYYRGKVNGDWAVEYPLQIHITESFVRRGQERFNIYCMPCHGWTGEGTGPVHQRAVKLGEPRWVPPASLLSDQVRERPNGHLFNTITHGIRNMPAYGPQIPVEDRWAIIAYVRALQLSRNADVDAVPPEKRDTLR